MSGSSVPEAARAAERRAIWTAQHAVAQMGGLSRDEFVTGAMALADAEVAAAVAEERATTGRRIEAIGAAVGALADRFARYCELTEEVTTPRDEASFRLGIECALDLAVDDLNAALDAPMIEGLWHGELVMPTDITRADAAEALHAFISARLASPGEETEPSCCANCGQPTLVPHRVGECTWPPGEET